MKKILLCLLAILFLQGTSYGAFNFVDNNNGTVTDARTGLVWLKNANPYPEGKNWADAIAYCNNLASGTAGLTDGSSAGQWRLPSFEEFEGIGTDPPATWYNSTPSVPWTMPGAPFINVQPTHYWSGTSNVSNAVNAWVVTLGTGNVYSDVKSYHYLYVWPVRCYIQADVDYWKTLYEQSQAELEACKNPTLVEMSSLEAQPSNKSITLKWRTESEIDNAGFNIWRADGFIKITSEMIPPKGTATEGAEYNFLDEVLFNRTPYIYLLEDVDNNGISTFHGPVKAVPRAIYGIGK